MAREQGWKRLVICRHFVTERCSSLGWCNSNSDTIHHHKFNGVSRFIPTMCGCLDESSDQQEDLLSVPSFNASSYELIEYSEAHYQHAVHLTRGGFLLPFSTTCTLLPLSVRNALLVCNQHATIIHK